MKHFLFVLAAFACAVVSQAQSPQLLSYQAVVRDNSNNPVANTTVGMRISILQGSATGTAAYVETQAALTNAVGLLSIQIGAGTVISGVFANINWAAGPFFIKTETDPTGGTSYSITGTTQLLSVPFALYAAKSGPQGQNPGDMLYWSGSQWVVLPIGKMGQQLLVNNTDQGLQPAWAGNSAPVIVTLPAASAYYSTGTSGIQILSDGSINSLYSGGYLTIYNPGIIVSAKPFTTLAMKDSIYNGLPTPYFSEHFIVPIPPNIGLYDTAPYPITITGLPQAGTTYYIESFASNQATNQLESAPSKNGNPTFGNQVSLTTQPPGRPIVWLNPAVGLPSAAVTPLDKSNAYVTGMLMADGDSPLTGCGFVWGTSANPDTTSPTKINLGNNLHGNNSDTGRISYLISGLTANTTYHIRGWAVNKIGVAYSADYVFTTNSANFYVGEPYGGGYVFYVDATGNHGLIASLTDQSTAATWWNSSYVTNGTSDTATVIGTGAANTAYIVATQGAGSYAASLASSFNGGGYTDWYLPSDLELKLMLYVYGASLYSVNTPSLAALNFANTVPPYWSSSEWPNSNHKGYAYLSVGFSPGPGVSPYLTTGYMSTAASVRAIRSF